jgi:hypothetical protein
VAANTYHTLAVSAADRCAVYDPSKNSWGATDSLVKTIGRTPTPRRKGQVLAVGGMDG